MHSYQLTRRFQAEGHTVLTWGDDSVPGVEMFPRTADGLAALQRSADILYVRVDANRLGDDKELVGLIRTSKLPVVWEINAPANENLAYSWLGGNRRAASLGHRLVDSTRRRIHAWGQMAAIREEEALRRSLSGHVAAALCVSASVATYAKEGIGIAEVHTVPNGADHEVHRPDGAKAQLPAGYESCLTVLYAGSPIYPWQGLGVLEEVIAMCERADDPVRFVLLLNQEGPRPIRAANTVTHVGVPHQVVGDFLRAVDTAVVIHPEFFWSRWGSHGSPMKLFDYMACGRPVVASNVGQLAEVIVPGRNGMLFDNTAADLRRQLLLLAASRGTLPTLGAAARTDVETTYNWHVIGRRTLQVLEAVVERAAVKP